MDKNHLAKQVDADVLAEHELHLAHPDALHYACCTLKLSKQTYRSLVAHTTYVNLRTSYPMKQTKIRSPTYPTQDETQKSCYTVSQKNRRFLIRNKFCPKQKNKKWPKLKYMRLITVVKIVNLNFKTFMCK